MNDKDQQNAPHVDSEGENDEDDLLEEEGEEEGPPKAPWHFKILVVGTIGYLIYRVIWFIGWISHHA